MDLSATSATYVNPVYPHDFPDPFVLRFRGRYYAYATGQADDGRFFRLLSSPDLVHWESHGGALPPLGIEGAEEYWAPEVAYCNGRFYMYYATGHSADPDHHLRVAVAEHPLGPWRDAGKNLTPHEIFAIDAHPYCDPRNGDWYLFYARDVLEPPYAGTGLAVDRLVDMETLEAQPVDMLRPYADWQVFELNRAVKNHLDWYTIEGPFVVRHEGRFVCFYSGGRWENPNYGVGYATAAEPMGPWVDDANAKGPQVLFTAPGQVIGPGHNSVIVGPDLHTPYIVYHGWDADCSARMMRIDELIWRDGRPACDGPSTGPRPAPRPADLLIHFDGDFAKDRLGLRSSGWEARETGLLFTEPQRLPLPDAFPEFRLELSVRLENSDACAGIAAGGVEVWVGGGRLWAGGRSVPLPSRFQREAWHTLHVCRQGDSFHAMLDAYPSVTALADSAEDRVSVAGQPGVELGHLAIAATVRPSLRSAGGR